MKKIKHKSLPIDKTINVKYSFGKNVYANDGSRLGIIKGIHIDPNELTIEGITVEKSVINRKYIGKEYIRRITNKGALLNIMPFTEYIGIDVVDKSGRKVGKVKQINRSKKTNTIISILVGRGYGKKDIEIKKDYIGNISKKIKLNVIVKEEK
ncbi:hypothetical protein JXB41_02935 [Candidatus Woesearchaeota archaeon]|nr:hypothetical protein [Candidatus Woesearchaeota archaeon]